MPTLAQTPGCIGQKRERDPIEKDTLPPIDLSLLFLPSKGKPGDCEDTWGLFNKVFADLWLNGADNQTCVALLILRCEVTPILFILKTLRCL